MALHSDREGGFAGSGRQKSQSYQEWASSKPNPVKWGAFNTESLSAPSKQDGWIYGAMRHISNGLAKVRPEFVDGGDDGLLDPDNQALPSTHEIPALWGLANPTKSTRGLQVQYGLYLSLCGEAVVTFCDADGRAVRPFNDQPDSLIPLPQQIYIMRGGKDKLRLKFGKTGQPIAWEAMGSKGAFDIPYASTVPVFYEDPDNPLRGAGPMEAAFGAAAQNYLIGNYNQKLVSKGGGPRGIVEFPPLSKDPSSALLTEPQFERAQAEVYEAFDSPEASGQTKVLHGGAKHKDNTIKGREAAWPELKDQNRKEIGAAFGVPDSLLGMGASNFATFNGERRIFWEVTLLPILDLISDAFNSSFFPRMQDSRFRNVRMRYPVGQIEALQGELSELVKGAQVLQMMGVPLGQALATAKIASDPVEGGDVPIISGGWSRLEDATSEPAPEPDPVVPPPATPDEPDGDEKTLGAVRGFTHVPRGTRFVDRGPDCEWTPENQVKRRASPPPAPVREQEGDGQDQEGALHTAAERRKYWEEQEELERAVEGRMTRAIQNGFRGMRKAQLRHLTELANSAKGAVGDVRASSAGGARALSADDARAFDDLAEAWLLDLAEARERYPDGVEVEVQSCCGEFLYRTPGRWQPRIESWEKKLSLIPGSAALLAPQFLGRVANLTPDEIEQLIVIEDAKLIEALSGKMAPSYLLAAQRAVEALEGVAGFSTDILDSADLLRFLKDKPIKVAEGITSTLANRVRTAIIEAIISADVPLSVGGVAQKIRDALGAVQAATRDEFNRAGRRSVNISRTEIGQTMGTARYKTAVRLHDEGLVDATQWIASGDGPKPGGLTRDSHHAVDGQIRPIGQPFILTHATRGTAELLYAKQPEAPGWAIISCRCKMREILKQLNEVQAG